MECKSINEKIHTYFLLGPQNTSNLIPNMSQEIDTQACVAIVIKIPKYYTMEAWEVR